MIISHRHRFIFIKTMKTAGTSVELALSRLCGPDDVLTPLFARDEEARRRAGGAAAQNYRIPLSRLKPGDWVRLLTRGRRPVWVSHVGASFIQRYVDRGVWRSYFKFCVERNPWEKVVSGYHWRFRDEPRPPDLSAWVGSGAADGLSEYDKYADGDGLRVDMVCRFERLPGDLEAAAVRIGLPEVPELPRAKGGARKERAGYRELLSPADRDRIARVFAREIDMFGWEW